MNAKKSYGIRGGGQFWPTFTTGIWPRNSSVPSSARFVASLP